jgi:cold shock CspA family protein
VALIIRRSLKDEGGLRGNSIPVWDRDTALALFEACRAEDNHAPSRPANNCNDRLEKQNGARNSRILSTRPRAYGFIRPDDGARDVFVHLESFPSGVHPEAGLRLEYDVGTDQRSGRLRATSVKVAE